MLKILLCLCWMKFIISEPTTEINTELPSFTNESSMNKYTKTQYENNESELLINDEEFSKLTQSEIESSVIPVDDLLDMVQNEVNKSEDIDKPHYIDFLTSLNELLNGNAQKVKMFYKHVLRIVDLGIPGSSSRQRSTTAARGMLQTLKDLWAWICRRIFNLTTWFKPNGSEKEIENLNKLEPEEKLKFLETHSKAREQYYATSQKSDKEMNDFKPK